ncbi:MAG TPA: hypothetical protein VK879_06465 [Candidatus Sulfomarinibacteraceae bacterium]|nr:hypothetical protein [Candidatus Sulfomarinibacteraceae bacterium]
MKSFETLRTWLIIIGLLLFSGLASLVWINVSDGAGGGLDLGLDRALAVSPGSMAVEDELITIQLDQYLLGEVLVTIPGLRELNGVQVHPLVIAGILTAVTLGGLLAMGLPLAFIFARLEQQTATLKEDPEFQEKKSNLENRKKEQLRELAEKQPPDPIPSHEMPRWATVSTSLIILFFVILAGYALADTFYPGGEIHLANDVLVNPALPVAGSLGLITLLILGAAISRRRPADAGAEVEARDGAAIPWGAIWVIVSGLIFLGIGTGLMLAIRSAGG